MTAPDTLGRSAARTRGRLIEAALDAFATSGFDGVSARHIERMAGVERGLIAYHFSSKQQLWNEAVDSTFELLYEELRSLREALRDVSRRERARAFLMAYTRFNAKHPEFFRILVMEGHVDNERSERLARQLRRGIQVFREFTELTGPVQTDDAIIIYLIMGAAGTVFATSAYREETFGIPLEGADFVERVARTLAAVGLNEIATRTTPHGEPQVS